VSDFHGGWHANVRTGGVDGMGKTADEKFRDLRESGYKGPIDQDGNAVADVDEWIDEQLPNR
jgi:hypothetical protein